MMMMIQIMKRVRKQLQSKSAGKAPWKQSPALLLQKKSGNKSKLVFTGVIKKPHTVSPSTVAL